MLQALETLFLKLILGLMNSLFPYWPYSRLLKGSVSFKRHVPLTSTADKVFALPHPRRSGPHLFPPPSVLPRRPPPCRGVGVVAEDSSEEGVSFLLLLPL